MAKSVPDLLQEVQDNSEKVVRVYNPDTEDFTVNYESKPHTVKALDYGEFEYNVGNHVKKHLITFLMNKRSLNPITDRKSVEKEVEFDK